MLKVILSIRGTLGIGILLEKVYFVRLLNDGMKLHRDLSNLPAFKNAVLTIGSFDGVHAGHQKLIERLKELALRHDGESIVISFDPHPRLVVYPDDDSLKLISTSLEKADLLAHYGVDHLVLVPFTRAFSQQEPETYIEDFLLKHFNPKCIVIGYDHKFGKGRKGDIQFLRKWEEKGNFIVEEISKQEVRDLTVSSTKIRKALDEGNVSFAAGLLKHPFSISGEVIYGKQIGTEIGFPTANISVSEKHKLIPPDGIYAVHVFIEKKRYGGMLYIGTRPTINGIGQSIEVNIFDFNQSIYGQNIRLDLLEFIRGDMKFDSLELMTEQLKDDEIKSLETLNKFAADEG